MSTLNDFIYGIKDQVNKQLPCQITTVNLDGTVDVLVFRNDDLADIVFPNVPVRHLETQKAYVFLGLNVGDRGVIRFFDKSVEGYKQGLPIKDIRQHSFSDNLFEYGFLPNLERYAFPVDKTIEIGNKNGSFKLSITETGDVELIANNVIATTKEVTINATNVVATTKEITLNATNVTATVQKLTATATETTLTCPKTTIIGDVNLGGDGGQPVARIGDSVAPDPTTGALKITSGSPLVKAV